MLDPNKVLKFLADVPTHSANRKQVRVEVLNSDNSTFETVIDKEEADLVQYLKLNIFPNLNKEQQTKLSNLIEEFASMAYSDGYDNGCDDAEDDK